MPVSQESRDILALISRSPDRGEGWRTVSPILWEELIVPFPDKELLELDESNHKVRLSTKGVIVAEYL